MPDLPGADTSTVDRQYERSSHAYVASHGTYGISCVTVQVLAVENTGETLTPQVVSMLVEPFQRGTERIRTDHAGVGLGLAIVKSISPHTRRNPHRHPRAAGGLASRCNYPPRHARSHGTIRWLAARPKFSIHAILMRARIY